jgi:hypothetical protein
MSDQKNMSLDENKNINRNVFIKHIDNTIIYQIPYTAAIHSKFIKECVINNFEDVYGKSANNPLIIPSTVKPHTIDFIVKYMNYYDDKPEKTPPEAPLQDIHLSVIFKDEYILFKDLHQMECDSIKTKMLEINDYTISAMYFNFNYLHEKLCALSASIFSNLSPDELNSIGISPR